MRPISPIWFFFVLVLWLTNACTKEQPADSFLEFTSGFYLLPETPGSAHPLYLVVHDCNYNQLVSVKKKGNDIEVIKKFNSQLKWPCILRADTIPLGQLPAGTYRLRYYLVDSNPFVPDSTFISNSYQFKVRK